MDLHRFLDQTGGVLALVSLTATVVWGLIATDRLVLGPRSRLLAQAVHRATAVGALGFLFVHVGVKVTEAHASAGAALLPFSSGVRGRDGLIALGSLAGHLMVLAAATGAGRSAFAGRGSAAHRWRALHGCAYAAWCAALLHGLNAGRAPARWVTLCYALCLAAVAGALLLRLALARLAQGRRVPEHRIRGRRRRPEEAVAVAPQPVREAPVPYAGTDLARPRAAHGAPGRHR
ncbi:hypothetical protein [Streptomyces sp. NPDC053079]|uniref:hypothetical protein n=1 Tax=Streptomyces sp. NPDC053079 TaxID=3365697 RepID=UPI0037D6BBA8